MPHQASGNPHKQPSPAARMAPHTPPPPSSNTPLGAPVLNSHQPSPKPAKKSAWQPYSRPPSSADWALLRPRSRVFNQQPESVELCQRVLTLSVTLKTLSPKPQVQHYKARYLRPADRSRAARILLPRLSSGGRSSSACSDSLGSG